MGSAVKIVLVTGVVVVVGGVILIRSCTSAAKSFVQDASRPIASAATVTLAEFEKITAGMTYAQVVEIIGGPGKEMSRMQMAGVPTTVTYAWDGEGSPGANMHATFQSGRLVTKAQFGLR